jgi:CRP-like cAMP-binding protein
MEILALLEAASFFKEVSAESKKAISRICHPRKLNKREVLFMEGQTGEAVYLMAEGNIQLYKTTPDGRDVTIKMVRPGELFAEVILFEKESFPVSAVAVEKSLVYSLPRAEFHGLLSNESFRNDFIGMLMRKQRYLVGQIMNLSASDVETRFFNFLEEQYGRHDRYLITIPKKDLAAAIGTNPETLSRLLWKLKEERILVWEGDRLRLRSGFWRERDRQAE